MKEFKVNPNALTKMSMKEIANLCQLSGRDDGKMGKALEIAMNSYFKGRAVLHNHHEIDLVMDGAYVEVKSNGGEICPRSQNGLSGKTKLIYAPRLSPNDTLETVEFVYTDKTTFNSTWELVRRPKTARDGRELWSFKSCWCQSRGEWDYKVGVKGLFKFIELNGGLKTLADL